MIINRIIIDSLDWIRSNFWSNSALPYKVINVEEYDNYQLKEIERLTKRSLLSYVYTSKVTNGHTYSKKELRKAKSVVYEYYICLDHLGDIKFTGNNKYLQVTTNTHSFMIIKTKRWVKNTNYIASIVDYVELNFKPRSCRNLNNCERDIDKFAIDVVKLALEDLKLNSIEKIKWVYSLNRAKVLLND